LRFEKDIKRRRKTLKDEERHKREDERGMTNEQRGRTDDLRSKACGFASPTFACPTPLGAVEEDKEHPPPELEELTQKPGRANVETKQTPCLGNPRLRSWGPRSFKKGLGANP
jgi:hypothetical protein